VTFSPQFRDPPVSEVALAAYFSPALGLQTVHLGQLYQRWREEYPTTVDQPLLPPVPMETFDTPSLGVAFQFGPHAGTRVWFQTPLGDRVIQVQADRVVLNWRRTAPDRPYPRYAALRPAFVRVLDDLRAVCEDNGLGVPQVSQAEVSYTNPVPRHDTPELIVSDVVVPWSGQHADAFLPPEEDVRLDLRYRIPDPASGAPVGRLYAGWQPVTLPLVGWPSPQDAYLLQLFARGVPSADQPGSVLAFLDLAHDWVVNGFVSLTSPRMHKLWGLMTEEDR
jgi:uncharacterized protein (TIGR04255 family)